MAKVAMAGGGGARSADRGSRPENRGLASIGRGTLGRVAGCAVFVQRAVDNWPRPTARGLMRFLPRGRAALDNSVESYATCDALSSSRLNRIVVRVLYVKNKHTRNIHAPSRHQIAVTGSRIADGDRCELLRKNQTTGRGARLAVRLRRGSGRGPRHI